MIKKITLSALLFLSISSFAQIGPVGHLTIFSEDGDKFTLILNGEVINDVPQTNLRVEDLNQPYYNAKIKFQDQSLEDVSKNSLMIAEGKIQPFIIVMTYGMTNEVKWGHIKEFSQEPFQKVLINELIPYVDANFRTVAKQSHRAMAGLSMGGMETHTITLNKPDVFSYYALLSGGIYTPEEIKDKSKVKLIFLSCGSKESPGRINDAVATLKKEGFNAVSYISENTAHEFLTWRRSLLELAPLLFKN